jgi:U3 small nucleolar RNA-associated protein 21
VYSASGEAELAPPPAEGAPPLEVRTPGVGDDSRSGAGGGGTRRGWGARGDGDDSEDEQDGVYGSDAEDDGAPAGVAALVEADGSAGADAAQPPPGASSLLPAALPQVAPRMVTLALLPRAQWMALLHLDTLRERGKPAAPAAKPAAAPFFLPTLATLAPHPVFDTDAAADGAPKPGGSRVLREGRGGGGSAASRSPLLRAIAAGTAASPPDYAAALEHLSSCGPSALDAELRSLTLSSPDAAALTDEDEASLSALLDFLGAALATGRAFELLHATLAATLRLHGEACAAHPALRARAAALRDAAGAAWGRLDKRFQEARCIVSFLAGLGQA